MARSKVLYRYDASRFRAAIRPSLVGHLAVVEPRIAVRAALEFSEWLYGVVEDTMRATELKDERGTLRRQLRGGARITGTASLASLRGSIWAYPWVFPHEYGAHIEPAHTRFLAIPIFHGLRPDGSPKFRNPRSWNRFGSFVYDSKRTGKKYLAYRGAAGDLRILYVLVDSVDIPARLGLNKMANSQVGALLSIWGMIYIQEMMAADITPINLWGRTQ